jgi:hypothetical protein
VPGKFLLSNHIDMFERSPNGYVGLLPRNDGVMRQID